MSKLVVACFIMSELCVEWTYMYLNIYIYICVCVCVCVCICVRACFCLCMYAYVCMHVYMSWHCTPKEQEYAQNNSTICPQTIRKIDGISASYAWRTWQIWQVFEHTIHHFFLTDASLGFIQLVQAAHSWICSLTILFHKSLHKPSKTVNALHKRQVIGHADFDHFVTQVPLRWAKHSRQLPRMMAKAPKSMCSGCLSSPSLEGLRSKKCLGEKWACLCVCLYLCVYVCMHMCIFIYVCVCVCMVQYTRTFVGFWWLYSMFSIF
jgi:hypothetical protein